MTFRLLPLARTFLVCSLVVVLISPQIVSAQNKVVQPSELKSTIARSAATRQKNLDQVRTFFSSKPIQTALSTTGIGGERLERSVSSLSDADLAKLAERTQRIQNDFAAGALSTQELTYIVIALAAAVLVLVVVAA